MRRLENLNQAIADKQTQQLPDGMLDQNRLAYCMGFLDWNSLINQCEQHMNTVHREFSEVIGVESPTQLNEDVHWQSLWQFDLTDEEAKSSLAMHQPQWPWQEVVNCLRAFKADIEKRGIGSRGKTVLDKLMPQLLSVLEPEACAGITLTRVAHVLRSIASRTAYFELLYENNGALKQLVLLCQKSQWLTDYLARFPILLDELIDPKLLGDNAKLGDYKAKLQRQMLRVPEEDLELQMETLRQFKQTHQLHVAAADISGLLPVTQVSEHLTHMAEAIIEQVVNLAWHQMVIRYGQPLSTINNESKDFAVIGYGKCGGRELSYSSDLDLVFVHNAKENDVTSGDRQIPASQFYLKMAQRILHIFSTRTTSGILYDVDMRLRPSGNSGLMVVHVSTYEDYLFNDAWTWEHQALVRARMTYGDNALLSEFKRIRHTVLSLTRDKLTLADDVKSMRKKMRNHLDKSTKDKIDLKQCEGGLADIEFITQFLILANSSNCANIMEYSDNISVLQALAEAGIISNQQAKLLKNSYLILREKGHQLALQNQPALVDVGEFEDNIADIKGQWHALLEAPFI